MKMSIKTIITLTYFILLFFGLLFPFSFRLPFKDVPNGLQWVPGGVDFGRDGKLVSAHLPQEFFRDIAASSGMTLEIWMSPNPRKSNHSMAIISCISPVRWNPTRFRYNFALWKANSFMEIELRYRTNNDNLNQEFPIGNVFVEGLQHIVVTYNLLHLAAYVNGKKHYESKELSGVLDNWHTPAFLVIGNAATGNAPYNGRLHEIAIYKRAMTEGEILKKYHVHRNAGDEENGRQRETDDLLALYDFDIQRGTEFESIFGTVPNMNLDIPGRFRVWQKEFLSPYYISDFYDYFRNVIFNILAFIPFGFILQVRLSQRYNYWFAAIGIFLLGLFFPLLFEISQFFVESRFSTLTDVVNNAIGVLVGICMTATKYGRELQKVK
jgi:hypothetical protein